MIQNMLDLNSLRAYNNLKDNSYTSDASQYIVDNFKYVLDITKKIAKEKNIDVEEVVQDVYVSFLTAEKAGKGYDKSKNTSVANFVFGRIAGYLKHDRYKGYDIKSSYKNLYTINESYSEDISLLYNNTANPNDDLEQINESISLITEIEMCLKATNKIHVNLDSLLRNTQEFSTKSIAWLLKKNLNTEELDCLRSVLEYPNRKYVLDCLAKFKIA